MYIVLPSSQAVKLFAPTSYVPKVKDWGPPALQGLSGEVRVEAGQEVIWDRFAPVLRGLVEKSNGFRTAMEAFRSKISGRYFVKCANVRYPPIRVIMPALG